MARDPLRPLLTALLLLTAALVLVAGPAVAEFVQSSAGLIAKNINPTIRFGGTLAFQTLAAGGILRLNQSAEILDKNGNQLIAPTATTSAVNGLALTNAATGNPPILSCGGTGSDANCGLLLQSKGDKTADIQLKTQRLRAPLAAGGTAASCTSAAACQAATVTGSDSAIFVQMSPTGSQATFTITFGGTWSAAPSCVVSPASSTAGKPEQVLTTTTTVQVLTASAIGAAAKYSILCWGVS
jgi:hypothetical protein